MLHLFSRCFQRCSTRAEHAVAHQETEKAMKLLDARIAECCAKEAECEQVLMQAQHALRCMSANLVNDPYPEVLMHRLKAQVMEKNAAQRKLDRTSAIVQQLKTQRRVLQDSELSSDVVYTLHRVLKRVQPHIKQTTSLSDKVVDLAQEQRDETADTTLALTHDLEDAFDAYGDTDDDMELEYLKQADKVDQVDKDNAYPTAYPTAHSNAYPTAHSNAHTTLVDVDRVQVLPSVPADYEAQHETEILMQAIRAGQRERLGMCE